MVKRIHKSIGNALIIYEIESTSADTNDISVFNVSNQIMTTVSSQLDAAQVRNFYFDLNFTPIDCITKTITSVNIFGVLFAMSKAHKDTPCTDLLVFDFEVGRVVVIKLWRGLAAWYSSLSLGCRLQIRSLTPKSPSSSSSSNELHSSSTTEIHLLAHGPGGKGKALSGRAGMLHEKEAIILNFLNHQSLLIPYIKSPVKRTLNLCLVSPLYLEYEHSRSLWTLQTTTSNVNFIHLDAKIWQKFLEIIDKLSNLDFSIHLNNLMQSDVNNFDFTADSSFNLSPITLPTCPLFKSMDWMDLCSSQVILYGVYSLKSLTILTNTNTNGGSSEESLGNLSILPQSMESHTLKLKCPHDDKYFIYPENSGAFFNETCDTGIVTFLVLVKTILNDGNVNEIIRKSVYILRVLKD